MVVKSKKKNRAMGDDPLLWIKEDTDEVSAAVSGMQQSQKASKHVEKGKPRSRQAKKAPDPESENNYDEQIVLDPVLAVDNAKKLYEQFNSVIQKNRSVIVNASAVEMIDTAMLQLLVAFVRKLQDQGIKISWAKPSDELMSRAELLDLKEHLNLD